MVYKTSECILVALRKCLRDIYSNYDSVIREESGLTANQIILMVSINTKGGCSPTALADLMNLDRTTITRGIEVLIKRGLIVRGASLKDKRVTRLTLSADGVTKLRSVMPKWEEATDKLISIVGADVYNALMKNSRKFYACMHAEEK